MALTTYAGNKLLDHLSGKMMFAMALDDGNILEADFYPVAKAIRGD